MTRSRSPSLPSHQRWLRAVPVVLIAACGGPQKLGDVGTTCFRDDDCAAGLICVAPMEGDINRVCSNDPTPLISNVEGPPVMEVMGGAGGMGGAMPMAGTGGGVTGGAAGKAGGGGADTAGTDTGGSAGTAGSPSGGGGSGGSAGSGGSDPEGGAPL